MKNISTAVLCLAFAGFAAIVPPAFAQEKTVKACQDEWRANKADNQANKITEKAYVEKCRATGATPASAAPVKAAAPATPATPSAPKAASTAAPAAPIKAAAPASPSKKSAPVTATAVAGVNQFSAEGQAKSRCPSDTVVWANLKSNIYHFSGKKAYGTTKSGAYMCEKDAMSQGIRVAKGEKHP